MCSELHFHTDFEIYGPGIGVRNIPYFIQMVGMKSNQIKSNQIKSINQLIKSNQIEPINKSIKSNQSTNQPTNRSINRSIVCISSALGKCVQLLSVFVFFVCY